MSTQIDRAEKILREFMVNFLEEASAKGVHPTSLLHEKYHYGDVRKVAQAILYNSEEDYLNMIDSEVRENTKTFYEKL